MSNIVTYEQMKYFENNENVLIIDVREPNEIQSTGLIGGSINIPLGSLEEGLKSSDEEFQKRFGRSKPESNFPIIFSCKMGGRAAKAEELAKALGFKKALIYKGSWTEWAEKNNL